MRIKTTIKYQFTSSRMVILKNRENNKCWWGCGEIGSSYTLQVGIFNGKTPVEERMEISQKIKYTVTIWSKQIHFEYLLNRIEIRDSFRCLSTLVHSNIIHNKKMKTTQCPRRKKWTNRTYNVWNKCKQTCKQILYGVLVIFRKEWHLDTSYKVDET